MAISRRRWGARGSWVKDRNRKHTLYLHHTVSTGKFANAAAERAHMRQLENQHIRQGWSTIGYSGVLFPSGRLYWGRGPTGLPAAQARANSGTVAIALTGNYENQKLTRRQKLRLVTIAIRFRRRYGVKFLGGHREAPGQSTACPGRNIMAYLPTLAKRSGLRRVRGPMELVIPVLTEPPAPTSVVWLSNTTNTTNIETVNIEPVCQCGSQVEYDYACNWYVCLDGHKTAGEMMAQQLKDKMRRDDYYNWAE